MITILPHTPWLDAVILLTTLLLTALPSAAAARRWGWRALPVALAVGTLAGLLILATLMMTVPLLESVGVFGAMAHIPTLILPGLVCAVLGFGAGLWFRPQAARIRPRSDRQ